MVPHLATAVVAMQQGGLHPAGQVGEPHHQGGARHLRVVVSIIIIIIIMMITSTRMPSTLAQSPSSSPSCRVTSMPAPHPPPGSHPPPARTSRT